MVEFTPQIKDNLRAVRPANLATARYFAICLSQADGWSVRGNCARHVPGLAVVACAHNTAGTSSTKQIHRTCTITATTSTATSTARYQHRYQHRYRHIYQHRRQHLTVDSRVVTTTSTSTSTSTSASTSQRHRTPHTGSYFQQTGMLVTKYLEQTRFILYYRITHEICLGIISGD